MADVRTIQFTKVVKEVLYSGMEFVKTAFSHDAFVNDDKVQIPTAGTLPDVEVDRSSFPIDIVSRTDDTVEYNLKEFSLGVLKLSEKEMKELSYDKMRSIVMQMQKKLGNRIALDALYNWAQSSPAIETTGTAVAGIQPTGATGTRQPLELADIANAAAKLDGDNVSQTNRYMIVPSNVYWNFVNNNKAQLLNLDYNKGMTNGDIANGVVSKVYGFGIIPRPWTALYTAAGALKAVGTAVAATDEWGIIGYQADEVCRALGSIKVYIQKDAPEYQGDLISATIRFGTSKMYGTAETGIVTIKQDT